MQTLNLFFGDDGRQHLHRRPALQPGRRGRGEEVSADEISAAADNELVKLVNKIIVDAYNQGASDIHIEPYPGKGKTVVRFRKDGSLGLYIEVPASYRNALAARLKIMCDLDISEKRKPQDGKIKFKKFGPLDIELRVATIPTAGGVEDIVMRILAAGEPIPLDKLGLQPAQPATRCKEVVSKPYGLFFVCGPTGSGKTTTLHSVLGYLNTPDTKIWTAEDPVEITQKGLRQVQVNPKAGLTFAIAMKRLPARRPGHHHGRRDARQGNRLDRHRGLAHRPPGVRHPAHQQRAGIDHPPARHGHGPVQLRRRAARHPGAAPGEAPVRQVQESRTRHGRTRSRSLLNEYCAGAAATPESWKKDPKAAMRRHLQGMAEGITATTRASSPCTSRSAATPAAAPATRAGSACTSCWSAPTRSRRSSRSTRAWRKCSPPALDEGMRTLKQDGIEKVLQGITDMKQVRAVCIK